MITLWLAWWAAQGAASAAGSLAPSKDDLQPRDNDVDALTLLVGFALLVLVLLVMAVALVLGLPVLVYRAVQR